MIQVPSLDILLLYIHTTLLSLHTSPPPLPSPPNLHPNTQTPKQPTHNPQTPPRASPSNITSQVHTSTGRVTPHEAPSPHSQCVVATNDHRYRFLVLAGVGWLLVSTKLLSYRYSTTTTIRCRQAGRQVGR